MQFVAKHKSTLALAAWAEEHGISRDALGALATVIKREGISTFTFEHTRRLWSQCVWPTKLREEPVAAAALPP